MATTGGREEKVRRIFQMFDRNRDGYLNGEEISALVVARNPRVKFSDDQLNAINEEVFRTYSDFIHGEKGITFEGLLRTYYNGAGDVDRDFDCLGLELNISSASMAHEQVGEPQMVTIGCRAEKVKRIFQKFDANRDGCLNREELSALVVARNPGVNFSDDQLKAINSEIFQAYSYFVDGEKGVTFYGILRSYDEGDGSVDRDFDILGLNLNASENAFSAPLMASERVREPHNKQKNVAPWNLSILFHNTWTIVGDLDNMVREYISKQEGRDGKVKTNNSADKFSEEKFVFGQSEQNLATFLKELDVMRSRANRECPKLEAFDRHMGIGMVLYGYNLFKDSLASFSIACELQPTEVIPHFRAGNCLYKLGRNKEAKREFLKALEIAEAGGIQFAYLLPQIHVNLGNVLQVEGMVFNAGNHYTEAFIGCPTHFRALKLLGSVLSAIGEYKVAVMALDEAVYSKSDDLDARFDLISALLAMGDQERAIEELIKVIDLKPDHMDALCSLAEVCLDKGLYIRASQTCDRILRVWHRLWKAQLCEAESLFVVGRTEEAQKYLKEALKQRVELHDRIAHLKMLQKMRLNKWEEKAYISVEPSKFKTVDGKTTPRSEMAIALDIRGFQKTTRLNQCDVELINNLINENYAAKSSLPEKFLRKSSIEDILCKLLRFSKPQSFVGAMKAINQKIFKVSVLLDESKSFWVDFGLFLAVVAPLCSGTPERRKRVAYNALLWRFGNKSRTVIKKSAAQMYIKLLRAIYIIPSDGSVSENMLENDHGEMDASTTVSFLEFLSLFNDQVSGFGIMFTLLKLETAGDANPSFGHVCATCHNQTNGLRFKEMKSKLNLCSECYGEGKVPLNSKQEEYIFKECRFNPSLTDSITTDS